MSDPDLESSKIYEVMKRESPERMAHLLRLLIKSGRNLGIVDSCGRGYIHHLVLNSDKFQTPSSLTAVYALCLANIDVNLRDEAGDTPLHLVVNRGLGGEDGLHPILTALLRCGADPRIKNNEGLTVEDMFDREHETEQEESTDEEGELEKTFHKFNPGLVHACRDGDEHRAEHLLKSWCRTQLFIDGRMRNVKEILEQKQDNDSKSIKVVQLLDTHGRTNELALATLAGDTRQIHATLKKGGCDINTRDHSYQYEDGPPVPLPLLAAAWEQDNLDLVDALMRYRPETSLVYSNMDKEMPMPVFFHVLCGHPGTNKTDIVYRVVRDADLTRTNHKGQSILFETIREEMSERFVYMLLRRGLDVSARDYKGRTARQFAEENVQDEYVELIDNYVYDLIRDNQIRELERMAYKGYDRIDSVLHMNTDNSKHLATELKNRRTYRDMDKFMNRLPTLRAMSQSLFEACETNRMTLIEELLERDCRLASCQNFCGQTAFHRALLGNNVKMLQFFCDKGRTCVNMPDNLQRSPLHYAVCLFGLRSKEVVTLLNAGANPEFLDALGRKPEHYDKKMHDTYSYEVLRNELTSFYAKVYVHDSELDYRLKSAISSGRVREVQEVVSEAKLNSVNIRDFSTVLFDCLETDHPDAALVLLENGADPNIWAKYEECNPENPICQAGRCDHQIVSLKERALEMGYDPLVHYIEEVLPRKGAATEPYKEKVNPFRTMLNFGSMM